MTASTRRSLDSPSSWRHRALFASLYFSEGAPIGYIWWALPTQLTEAGVGIAEVTALSSLLVLPWTLKFLWAPLIDALQSRWWTLRHWIVAAQFVMTAALVPLWGIDMESQYALLRTCLLVHGFAAATQDVAIDAWCVATIPESERGRINGWMQAGMLLGRSLLGGGALVVAARYGESAVLVLLATSIMIPALLVITTRDERLLRFQSPSASPIAASSLRQRFHQFFGTFKQAASHLTTWWGIGFALTAGAAFEILGTVQGPLMQLQGWTSEEVGWLLAVPVVICMIVGSLLGGRLADRFSHRRVATLSLGWLLLNIAAIAGLTFGESAVAARGLIPLLLCSQALGVGAFTSSSYALLMNLTSPAIAATQFSTFMAAVNGCEAWSVKAGGVFIDTHGYGLALLIMVAFSTMGFVFLSLLRRPPPQQWRSG